MAWKVPAMVSSTVVFGVLTLCTLFHSVCDLKAAEMNVQRCLIRELMLYEFKLSCYAAEATKISVMGKVKAQLVTVQ